MMHYVKTLGFYLLVALIILIAVFPFYYAIITSLKSGTALFRSITGQAVSHLKIMPVFSHRAASFAVSAIRCWWRPSWWRSRCCWR